jgi:hypothetical protein
MRFHLELLCDAIHAPAGGVESGVGSYALIESKNAERETIEHATNL